MHLERMINNETLFVMSHVYQIWTFLYIKSFLSRVFSQVHGLVEIEVKTCEELLTLISQAMRVREAVSRKFITSKYACRF